MTEGMLPQRAKSEELEFMEQFIERALDAGLTDQEASKAIALVRYWNTLEPTLERTRKAAQAGREIILATRAMLRTFRQVLVAYGNLKRDSIKYETHIAQQDATELDASVKVVAEALLECDKKIDEAHACLTT